MQPRTRMSAAVTILALLMVSVLSLKVDSSRGKLLDARTLEQAFMKQTTFALPEGATVTVFKLTPNDAPDAKEVLLKKVKEAAEVAGLALDAGTNCFCSYRCVCSKVGSAFQDDAASKMEATLDIERMSLPPVAIPTLAAMPDSDFGSLRSHKIEQEFIRLKTAAVYLADGLSASRLSEISREAKEKAEQDRLQAIADEEALRLKEKEDEVERQELDHTLRAREKEINLLEEALDVMVNANMERAASFADMQAAKAALQEKLNKLVLQLHDMMVQQIADLQLEIQKRFEDFEIDSAQKISKAAKDLADLAEGLKGMTVDFSDADEEKLKKLLAEWLEKLEAARRAFNATFSALGEGWPCDDSLNCMIAEQCLLNKCITVAGGSPCVSTADCGNGQFCNSGGECAFIPDGTSCTTHDMCGRSMNCDEGQCFGAYRIGIPIAAVQRSPCDTNRDCIFGQVCEEDSTCGDPKDLLCDATADCANGFTCTSGVCVEHSIPGVIESCGFEGANVTECSSGATCFNLTCTAAWGSRPGIIPVGSFCTSSMDCGKEQRCEKDKCVEVDYDPEEPEKCEVASDCVNGLRCEDSVCVTNEKLAANCTGSVDCGFLEGCVNSVCVGMFGRGSLVCDAVEGDVCSSTLDCGFEHRCIAGKCINIPEGSHCGDNSGCANGQLCRVHKCVTVGPDHACKRDDMCAIGHKCIAKTCQPVFANGGEGSSIITDTGVVVVTSPCTGNMGCADNHKCTNGLCLLVPVNSKCKDDVFCGNGQRCFKGKCQGLPEWSPCDAKTTCANGLDCIKGKCMKQYCNSRPQNFTGSPIPPGAPCSHRSDCGDGQVCAKDQCVMLQELLECDYSHDCGNGARCTRNQCRAIPKMYPCSRNNECGMLQVCSDNVCRNTYGGVNQLELATRAKEDFMMNLKWQDAVMDRIDYLEKLFKETVNSRNETHTTGGDFVRSVADLAAEREKLAAGRKVLESEVSSRASGFMDKSNGANGEGCELCKAQEDIHKLQDEVERLKEELKSCKDKPEAYIPTCEEDLNFQLDRLKEEIHRRRALLEEEIRALQQEYERTGVALQICRDQAEGCAVEEEESLLLRMKQIEDELYMRKKYQEEKEKFLIYQCLWQHHEVPMINVVGDLMTTLDHGCPKLKEYDEMPEVFECMCEDWEEYQKIKREAEQRAAKASAVKEALAAVAAPASREEAAAEKREEEKRLAEEVAKQLLWKHMKAKPGFQELLKQLAEENPDDVLKYEELEAERLRMLEDCAAKGSCTDVEVSAGPAVSPAVVDECLGSLRSGSIKSNIRKSFTEGNSNNGCALLALASNAILQDVYKCLCIPSSA